MPKRKKTSIKLNSVESLQSLMQESYRDSCSLMNDVGNVIEKLENDHKPENVDDLAKITKEKVNALKLKESAIKLKLQINQLQNDFIKHNGEIKNMNQEYDEMVDDPLSIMDEIRDGFKNKK